MKRKMLAIVLTMSMILSMMPAVAFAADDDFHDIDGHWAEEVIEKWADRDIVSGMGNNTFSPNGNMTRAQAASVFAKFFGLFQKGDISHFTDVEDVWYKDAIAMCYKAGIMSGVGNGKMDPNGTLTREQMFVMFANGLGIKPEDEAKKDFADDHKTSGWAQGYINALVNRDFVSGMAGNKLAPEVEINRASVMALIDSAVAEYVTENGATVEAPKDGGLVIVVAEDVTITGELSGTVLAVGGDTTITVEKATADAEIVVASGSENVTVSGEFAGTVTVTANDTTVTVENATEEAKVVVVAENTTVEGEIKGTVEVAEGATGTTVAAEASKVEVTGESASVEVTGKVETLEVKDTAAGSTVEVAKDATVETLKTDAEESTVNVAGTVKEVEVTENAGNTTVSTESTAKVESVKTEAAGTTVEGTGKVEKVEATENATGTTVNTNGSTVENNSKEDVTVGTGTVESGSTGTSAGETSKPTEGTTTPSTPSTGGSTGGSSKPSHSHTWGAWTPNYDGTHTRTYSCGHSGSETADCTYVEGKCSVCGTNGIVDFEGLKVLFATGGTAVVVTDVTIREPLTVTPGATVVLNLKSDVEMDASSLKEDRPFHMGEGSSLTINADETNTIKNGEYGIVNVPETVKNADIILNGGSYTGTTVNGALVRIRSGNERVNVTLKNVSYTDDNGYVLSTQGYGEGNIIVEGGNYNAKFGFQATGGTKITGVTATMKGTFIEAQGENIVVENCDITINPGITVVNAPGSAVAVSYEGSVTIKNSKISGTMQAVYYVYNTGGTITVENTDISGVVETNLGICQDDYKGQGKGDGSFILIDGGVPVESTEELNTLINSSDDVTITLAKAGTYFLNSTNSNKNISIIGSKDTVIDMSNGVYMDSSTVSFDGVTIKLGFTKVNGGKGSDYTALYSPNAKFTDCTFDGGLLVGRNGAKFIGCTFNLMSDSFLGVEYVRAYGNDDLLFEGCTFNTDGKALLLYSDGNGEVPDVTVTECTFNATTGARAGAIANQNCAAIEIDNYGCGVNLILSNNTIDDDFSGEWRIKTYYDGKESVIVNGQKYTQLALDGKLMNIDADKNVSFVE